MKVKFREIIGKSLLFDVENIDGEIIDGWKDKELELTVKPYKNKRSLDANAYFWKLCTELANVLRMAKEEMYLTELEKYGQSEIVSVKSEIDVKGFFKYYREIGRSCINDKEFTHYKVFKGSSEYDSIEMSILIDGIISDCKEQGIETSIEMSILIDGIISDCKEQGIETETPEEIQKMNERWKSYEH